MGSAPKILFVGRHDWANFAHRIARALRAVGADARVLVLEPHPYGYEEDQWPEGALSAWIGDGVTWLLSTGDGSYDFFRLCAKSIPYDYLGALHVGSEYRRHHEQFNAADHEMGARVQFVGVDSMRFTTGLTSAYPMWVAAEHWAEPDENRDGILHCPSNRGSKGTADIIRGAELAGVKITLLENTAPGDVIAAMGKAAVYIDQINAEVGGMGCAAMEAAAMGCAVITDGRHWPLHCPWSPSFTQVRNTADLFHVLSYLKGDGGRAVRTGWLMHHAPRDHRYACNFGSQKYVGEYWLNILDGNTW